MTTTPSQRPPVTHALRLFVGSPACLERLRRPIPAAPIYRLRADHELLVLPFEEAIQDALHLAVGTRDWPARDSHALSLGDMAAAAAASEAGRLAWVETDYVGPDGRQSAAVWIAGALVMAPASLDTATALRRPAAFWPINAALRAIGVRAAGGADEFTAFGLASWTSNAAIHSKLRSLGN